MLYHVFIVGSEALLLHTIINVLPMIVCFIICYAEKLSNSSNPDYIDVGGPQTPVKYIVQLPSFPMNCVL